MTGIVDLSWNMRHQLLLTRSEYAQGRIYNPHHVVYAVDIRGPLDLTRLTNAWTSLQRRHVGLQLAFDMTAPRATASAHPSSRLELRHPAEGDSDSDAKALLQAAVRAPFDLTRGPLARLIAVPIADNRTLLALSVEHVVCDAWSYLLLISELWSLYREPTASLPPVKRMLGQHIAMENEWLESADGRRAVTERARALDGLGPLPQIELPGLIKRDGPVRLAETRSVDFRIDAAETAALRSRGAPLGLTVSALAQAAYSAALATLSGQRRVGVVLSTANRAHADLRATVGWVSNKIVVPVTVRHDPNTDEFLRDFAEEQASALDHAAIPFGKMLHVMNPSLFGVPTSYPWVGYNPRPATMARYFPPNNPPELAATEFAVPSGWNEKSLVAYATERDGELRGSVAYKPYWYGEDVAQAVATQITAICRGWTK
ncbi:condensation domain-containing protein [Micromonospora maritima]|uniref:condensation domain-containing protein n=1 Tax=Micromonospora maritima TaxID=986711 RepID=UPI00378F1B1C